MPIIFIKVKSDFTKKMPTLNSAVRQGTGSWPNIESNGITDEIIEEVKGAAKGYRMGDKEVEIICYADAEIIFEDEDNLQRLQIRIHNGKV